MGVLEGRGSKVCLPLQRRGGKGRGMGGAYLAHAQRLHSDVAAVGPWVGQVYA